MKRDLAKELKIAGFPMPPYRAGRRFYPHEDDTGWTDAARRHGVTVTHYDLEDQRHRFRSHEAKRAAKRGWPR